ncbi:MAG: DUF2905 domain-containing protein [Candidatus Thermochlorobacter aerophilum]|uniref:DUF2905 domain-containing protein n=1 Tax=Candidatus Thermochlorobacter aerophilus TaxID=1868324 RepID=A0A395M197_9BACT|nr:MAG: DUF2905 domain-containing protein [Candidatus Thermochlorobacter aerophilum]
MSELGKSLIFLGALLLVIGFLLYLAPKVSLLNWFGRLPLDFKIERENFSFYFPLGTSIVISVLLSLVFYLLRKFSE